MQVGDRVRCIARHGVAGQFTPGNIYVVREVNEWSVFIVADDSGHDNGWSRGNFELVQDDGREEVVVFVVFYKIRANQPLRTCSWETKQTAENWVENARRVGYEIVALKKFKTRI